MQQNIGINSDRRWYDKEPACTKLVEQLKALEHPRVREFCGKLLLRFIDEVRQVLQNKKGELSPVSLGLPALQGLYKGKQNHHRWYDDDKIMQRAISTLYSLPLAGLSALSFKLSDTLGLIGVYDYVCIQIGQEPVVRELFNITKSGVEVGKDEAERILTEIVGPDLYEVFSREFQER